jgi:hypothetical protein
MNYHSIHVFDRENFVRALRKVKDVTAENVGNQIRGNS